jgi:hypothetical protein
MRRGLVLVGVILVASVAACGSDSDDEQGALPPNRRDAIAAPFASELEDLGLRITRAAVVDADTGTPAPGATHLAVYVEPTGAYSPDDFATGIATVTRVFLPTTFDRWPGLTSFDVCQEPLPGVDDSRTPPPKTQIAISHDASDAIDWDGTDLQELLAMAARQRDDSFTVFADEEVSTSATFQLEAPDSSTPVPSGGLSY